MIDDPSRTPVDRSADPAQGHLLPPADGDHRLLRLEPAAPRAIEWTVDQLVAGGVVAFPTDTVYALAASLAHPAALRRIFALKGRPPDKPLPVLLASAEHLGQVGDDVDDRIVLLLDRYWPGPLTVVVPARAGMPPEVLAPDGTIGVRVPNHFLALELIERAGGAIAATSANRSDEPPAVTAAEVAARFGDEIDVLLDGGLAPGGVPSTVIAVGDGQLLFLRDGAIPREILRAAWDEISAGRPPGQR
jgi:L-threonylcarbamoyladenylate synthase